MELSSIQLASAAATLVVAAAFDIRQRRVPNWLSYGAAVAGVGFQAIAGSGMESVLGFLVCGGVGVLLYVVSRLGAGDTKLLMAVGAWLGPGLGLDVALLTLVGGAVVGIVLLFTRGYLLAMIRELWLCVLTLSTPGTSAWIPHGGLSFPLAPVMLCAFALVASVPALRPLSPLLEAAR